MILELRTPRPPLSEFVELLTYYEGYSPGHSIERLLPEGVVEVIIDLTEEPKFIYDNVSLKEIQTCRKAWVSGMRSGFISISAVQRSAMFVIRFRPGQAWPFIQMPLTKIDNSVVDADLVIGKDFPELREKLISTHSIPRRFVLVEEFVNGRICCSPAIHPAVHYAIGSMLRSPCTATIKDLIVRTGYSQKHFIALFGKYAGLTPKRFLRVLKFQHTVNAIEHQKKINWSQLAIDCGYYDQAHFINDFKQFSGFSPHEYMAVKGDLVNYIPIR